MKKNIFKIIILGAIFFLFANLFGCAALKKKLTPKKKEKAKKPVYFQVRKYDIKPSFDLYEKHYVFWINWHKKLIVEIGDSYKNDKKCAYEIIGNLEDMVALLVDEKQEKLMPHIRELEKGKAIIDRRNMTKANETRIKLIFEREYRAIKRDFSPKEMTPYIRKEWGEWKVE